MSLSSSLLLIGVLMLIAVKAQNENEDYKNCEELRSTSKYLWDYQYDPKTEFIFPQILNTEQTNFTTVFAVWNSSLTFRVLSSEFTGVCKIATNLTDPLAYPGNAWALGNGKIIITLHTKLSYFETSETKIIIIIDPKNCHHKVLEIPAFRFSFINLLPYEDSFDVVLFMDFRQSILKYTDEGVLLNSFFNSFSLVDFYEADENLITITPAKEYDSNHGYYSVDQFRDITVIRKLDSMFNIINNYTILRSKTTPKSISAKSIQFSAEYDKFSSCYLEKYDFSKGIRTYIQCLVLNANFTQVVAETQLLFYGAVSKISMRNLVDGLLIFAYTVDKSNSPYIVGQKVTYDGKIERYLPCYVLSTPITSVSWLDAVHQIPEIYLRTYEMRNTSLCVAAVIEGQDLRSICLKL